MPEAGGGARLSELEARWRTDRSPRVFLQLADELRRAGAQERAVRILQEGLAHHPDSVSGRVALGRLLLEQGDAPGAAETLERALARDPAQMVASKLLIETWIRMGDATRARERLDLYRILQERDGEIDDFERRIAAMERAERQAALEADRASRPVEPAEGGEGEWPAPASSSLLFNLGVSPVLPPLDLMTSLALAPAETSVPARSAPAGAHELDARMPFGAIHEAVVSAARIDEFLRAEALFVLPPAGARPARAAETAAQAAEVESVPVFGFSSAASERTAELQLERAPSAGSGTSERQAEAIEAATEPEPLLAFEQFSTLTFAGEVERDTLEEPLAHVLAEAGADASAPLVLGSFAGEAEEQEPEEPRAEPGSAAGTPSATLARLYLDQGHLAEAEAEFRRVLSERPDDQAASAGLRDLGRRRAADETVSGWADATGLAVPRPPRAVGLTQRKVGTLRDYLERIRRSRPRAHVS